MRHRPSVPVRILGWLCTSSLGPGPGIGTGSRARTTALITSSAVVLLLLAVVGWAAWPGPDGPSEARTRGPAAVTASSAGIGSRTASPTPIRTTPPPPAGFRLVGDSGYTLVVPSSWTESSNRWDNYREGKTGTVVSVDVGYFAQNKPMVAGDMLSPEAPGSTSSSSRWPPTHRPRSDATGQKHRQPSERS